MNKRIMSLVLAILVLITMIPVHSFAENDNPEYPLHEFAKITSSWVMAYAYPGASAQISSYADFPGRMEIVGIDTSTGTTLYQLNAAQGYSWPVNGTEQKFSDGIWVEAGKVIILVYCDICEEYDCGIDHGATEPSTEPTQPGTEPTQPEGSQISGVVTDEEGNPVRDASGEPLVITVQGDLPKGAVVQARTIEWDLLNEDAGLFDIKVIVDGQEWQPMDDQTVVTVSIPVNADWEYVDIIHFVDYAVSAHDNVEYVSIEGVEDLVKDILADAIAASDREGYVALESFKNVTVENGFAQIQTDSFSVYKWENGSFNKLADENNQTNEEFNNSWGNDKNNQVVNEYYATKDHKFKLTTSTIVSKTDCAFEILSSVNVTEGSITGTFNTTVQNAGLTDTDGGFWDYHDATVVIPETAAPGETIVVRFKGASYTFYLIIHIVESFTVTFESPFVETVEGSMPASISGVSDGDPNKKIVTIPSTEPTAKDSHYSFVGWNTQSDGNGTYYDKNYSFNPMTSMTLYAIWHKDTSIVNYDPNGGTGNYDEDILVKTGNSIQLPEGPERANYEFLGWSSSKDGSGTIYGANTPYTVNQDVTLYAIWGVKLTVNAIGGTLKMQRPGEYSPTALDQCKDAAGNLIFENKGTVNSVTTYEAIVVEGSLKNAIIYFSYNSTSQKLTIEYDGAQISINEFDNEARATVNGDVGVDRKTEITFAATDKNVFVIYFNTNGGTAVPSVLRYQGGSFSDTDNDYAGNPTKQGYTFAGWYQDAVLQDGPYRQLSNITKNITLYAKWTADNYTITYDSNGGNAVDPKGYTIQSQFALPEVTREGYTFAGWKVVSTDGNWVQEKVYSGNIVEMYGNVTLVAQWNPNVDLRIDGNGILEYVYEGMSYGPVQELQTNVEMGSFAGIELIFSPNAGYRIQTITVTVGGVALPNQTPNADGSYIYTVDSSGITQPLRIEVTTSLAQHTVTYVNSYDSQLTKEQVEHGADHTLPTPSDRPGYAFEGWYLDENCSGEAVTVLENVTADITVYAKWSEITYTVEFHYQYDSKVETLTFTVTSVPTVIPSPERTGYSFEGWFADPDCTGEAYNLQTLYEAILVDEDHTIALYAGWDAVTYTVHYDCQDGSQVKTVTFTVESLPTELESPEKADHVFHGWYATSACAGDPYTAESLIQEVMADDDGEITVYAKWTMNLTITTQSGSSDGQHYLFTVTGEGVELTVVLSANESRTIVGLPVGTYTVTYNNAWSWKYKLLESTSTNTQWTFKLGAADSDWLGGEGYQQK